MGQHTVPFVFRMSQRSFRKMLSESVFVGEVCATLRTILAVAVAHKIAISPVQRVRVVIAAVCVSRKGRVVLVKRIVFRAFVDFECRFGCEALRTLWTSLRGDLNVNTRRDETNKNTKVNKTHTELQRTAVRGGSATSRGEA